MAGPAMDPRGAALQQMLVQGALQRGVDPNAVLSIASVEGGFNGAIGDNGTSFGPFQLHMNGALPSQFNGNAQGADQFSNSQAGIGYALDAIAKVAKGLKGQDAVSAISREFERPADPAGEISKAMGRYGSFAGGQGGQFTDQPYQAPGGPGDVRALQGAGISPMPQQGGQGGGGAGLIQQLAAKLLTQQAPQITPVGQQPAAGGTARASGIVQLQQPQNAGSGILQMAMSRLGAQATHDTFGATPSAQTPVTGPAPQGAQGGIVKTAMSQIGIPYQWGGQAKLGGHTDCSGLAQAVYQANGINIPRTTYDQWKAGTPVKPGDIQPGDLVFFHMSSQGPSHVGIYKGNGQFIEDPHTGASVKTQSLANYPGFVGARRFT